MLPSDVLAHACASAGGERAELLVEGQGRVHRAVEKSRVGGGKAKGRQARRVQKGQEERRKEGAPQAEERRYRQGETCWVTREAERERERERSRAEQRSEKEHSTTSQLPPRD